MNHAKVSALALAMASMGAGGAYAASPVTTHSFYISGASAARAVTPAVASKVCAAGTIARYEYSVNVRNYNLTACTLKTSAQDSTIPAELSGDTVTFYGRADGGSLLGLKPILVPAGIRFLNPATCPTNDGVDATVQQCTGLTGADFNVTGIIPDAGISDEDPQFLGAVSIEVDTSQPDPLTVAERNVLNGTTASGFTSQGSYQLVWSVQAGSTFPLNNISYEAWRGVMSGQYTSVGDVMRSMGVAPSPAQAAAGLKVCLRTNTSGTMSGHTHLALGSAYCGTAGALPALNETSDDGVVAGRPANYDVVLNSSSGNLETCLTTAADLSRSIGINSLENAGANANIKELQIDGVTPSVANAATGVYRYYHESTVQWNTDFIDGPAIGGRSTAAARNAFLTLYNTNVSNPQAIAASGLNGILATPFNGAPDLVFSAANPVGWTSKLVGFGGSNCNEPQLVFPAADTE